MSKDMREVTSVAARSPRQAGGPVIPFVILLTGLPAAGKTTVGRPVAEALGLPDLRSDSIKEAMFDSIGYGTLPWSEFLTIVCKEIAFRVLPQIGPCVLDVFMPREEARERLSPIARDVVEIHCSVPYELAWKRFIERARSGNRHRGHVDANVELDFFVTSLRQQRVDRPFALGGPVLELDTTTEVDLAYVINWARGEMAKISQHA